MGLYQILKWICNAKISVFVDNRMIRGSVRIWCFRLKYIGIQSNVFLLELGCAAHCHSLKCPHGMIHNNRTLNVPCKGLTCTVEDDADRCCRYDTVRYDTCAANIYSSDGRICQIVTGYDTKKETLETFPGCDRFDDASDFRGWSCGKLTTCGPYGKICGGFNVKVRHKA